MDAKLGNSQTLANQFPTWDFETQSYKSTEYPNDTNPSKVRYFQDSWTTPDWVSFSLSDKLGYSSMPYCLAISPQFAIVATGDNVINSELIITNDSGVTWQNISFPEIVDNIIGIIQLQTPGSYLCAANHNGGLIFKSTDYGYSWSKIEILNSGNRFYKFNCISQLSAGYIYIGGSATNGTPLLLRSSDYGQSWTQVAQTELSGHNTVYSVCSFGTKIAFGTNTYNSGNFFISDNVSSLSWSKKDLNSSSSCNVLQIEMTTGLIMAITSNYPDNTTSGDNRLWRSVDSGSSFSHVSGFLTSGNISFLRVNPFDITNFYTSIGTGSETPNLYKSTDSGLNWTLQTNPLTFANVQSISLFSYSNGFISGTINSSGNRKGIITTLSSTTSLVSDTAYGLISINNSKLFSNNTSVISEKQVFGKAISIQANDKVYLNATTGIDRTCQVFYKNLSSEIKYLNEFVFSSNLKAHFVTIPEVANYIYLVFYGTSGDQSIQFSYIYVGNGDFIEETIVPIIYGDEESSQQAAAAVFTNLNAIPQLPGVGVPYTDLLTNGLAFANADAKMTEQLSNSGLSNFRQKYSVKNNEITITTEKTGVPV